MTHRKLVEVLTVLMLVAVSTGFSLGQSPGRPVTIPAGPPIPIRFSGYLPGTADDGLQGRFTLEFRIYRSPRGGEPVWREEHELDVVNGHIDVQLGLENPVPDKVHEETFKWLGASVNGGRETLPRYPIVNIVFVSVEEALVAQRERGGDEGTHMESTLAARTEARATWRHALDRARTAGGDLPDYREWYASLESGSQAIIAERAGHYEWVLPWAYDAASHGRYDRYFSGRPESGDHTELSPQQNYHHRIARPLEDPRGGVDRGLDRSVQLATSWLLRQQAEDGGFHAGSSSGVPPVALTAMALWSLSVESHVPAPAPLAAVCAGAERYLLQHQQEDGGIYRPGQALPHMTSAVVRQALRAWAVAGKETPPTLAAALTRLDAYLAEERATESWTQDSNSAAAKDLQEKLAGIAAEGDISPGARRALEFLKGVESGSGGAPVAAGASGASSFTYDHLLGQLGEVLLPTSPKVLEAQRNLRERYTLEENPDLTQRFGPGGFQRGDSGLYYYFLTVARVLGTVGDPVLETADGTQHPWAAEIEERLLRLQRPDGSWVNRNGRWCENEPILVTSYALITVSICRRIQEEL